MLYQAIRSTMCCVLVLALFPAFGQNIQFDILKGGDVIGNIQADRIVKGEDTFYSMVSNSEFSIIWSNSVQSTTLTHYRKGTMYTCGAHMRINSSMRDSSNMWHIGEQAHCYVHPNKRSIHTNNVSWTTARMYYEEPVGQLRIFVESEMTYCDLVRTGPGKYSLTMPSDKVNRYVYSDGILREVQVDRTFVNLVFRRV